MYAVIPRLDRGISCQPDPCDPPVKPWDDGGWVACDPPVRPWDDGGWVACDPPVKPWDDGGWVADSAHHPATPSKLTGYPAPCNSATVSVSGRPTTLV